MGKDIELVYYSATGNTKGVIEYIAKKLNVEAKGVWEEFGEKNIIILGFPVHNSLPPRFVRKLIKNGKIRGKKVIILITYGLPYLGKFLGFVAYLYAKFYLKKFGNIVYGPVLCPGRHSIVKFLNKGHPNERDKKKALEMIEVILKRIS